jgi:hypothetical protein
MEVVPRFFQPPAGNYYLFGRSGMLPLVLDCENEQDFIDSYIDVYIREEVQAEGLVRNLNGFSRFLEAISFSQGQVLQDLLLCFRLPVFRKRAGRTTVQHPKFYPFDTGVFRSLRPLGSLDIPEETAGPALEGLVAQHLRAWTAYTRNRHELYYWRTRIRLDNSPRRRYSSGMVQPRKRPITGGTE